jgi:hypothetical protein
MHAAAPAQAAPAPPQAAPAALRHAYIYVDNSNLLYTARNAAPGGRDDSIMLNVRALSRLLEGGLPCAERVVAGSNMPDSLQGKWEEQRFAVKTGACVPGQGERFVDEALHSCISRVLLDDALDGAPQVLVLGTGDGNEKEGTNSFPSLARSAARKGWHVVVWAWRASMSPRFEHEVRREFPHLVKLCYLDDHRDAVTFRASPKATRHSPPAAARAPHQPAQYVPHQPAVYSPGPARAVQARAPMPPPPPPQAQSQDELIASLLMQLLK